MSCCCWWWRWCVLCCCCCCCGSLCWCFTMCGSCWCCCGCVCCVCTCCWIYCWGIVCGWLWYSYSRAISRVWVCCIELGDCCIKSPAGRLSGDISWQATRYEPEYTVLLLRCKLSQCNAGTVICDGGAWNTGAVASIVCMANMSASVFSDFALCPSTPFVGVWPGCFRLRLMLVVCDCTVKSVACNVDVCFVKSSSTRPRVNVLLTYCNCSCISLVTFDTAAATAALTFDDSSFRRRTEHGGAFVGFGLFRFVVVLLCFTTANSSWLFENSCKGSGNVDWQTGGVTSGCCSAVTEVGVWSKREIRLATEAGTSIWEDDALEVAVGAETGVVVGLGLDFLLSQEVISTTCMLVARNCFLDGALTLNWCSSVSLIADLWPFVVTSVASPFGEYTCTFACSSNVVVMLEHNCCRCSTRPMWWVSSFGWLWSCVSCCCSVCFSGCCCSVGCCTDCSLRYWWGSCCCWVNSCTLSGCAFNMLCTGFSGGCWLQGCWTCTFCDCVNI